jgi:hypothetical protein
MTEKLIMKKSLKHTLLMHENGIVWQCSQEFTVRFRKGEIRAGDRTYDGVWEVTHGVQVKASETSEHAISVLGTAIIRVR